MSTRTALAAFAILLLAPRAEAQPTPSTAAAASVWEVQIDLQKALASPIGQAVMELARQKEPAVEQKIDELSQAVGFDLRTAVGPVRIVGNTFVDLEDSKDADVSAIVSLGESRGNIEGLLLAAPGYQSEDLDQTTQLHSFKIEEGDHRLWCALPRDTSSNRYTLVAALNRDTAVRLAEEAASNRLPALASGLSGDTLLTVRVNELSSAPIEIDEDDAGAGLLKVVRSVAVDVASAPEQVSARCTIETDSPAQAEQVHQLLVGLKAMLALAAPKDDAAQKVLELMNRLSLSYVPGETTISTELSANQAEVVEFLKQNM